MIKDTYEMEVLVNGRPLKEYLHEGRHYVEGRKGTNFSIKVRNNSNQRVLFVPSVDGLSVIDGKSASFESSGYIVKPWSSAVIDGWRVSDSEVSQFFFTNPGESYSSRSRGGEANLGVIGVAVFKEKVQEYKPGIFSYHTTEYTYTTGDKIRKITTSNVPGTIQNSGYGVASLDTGYINDVSSNSQEPGLGTGWGGAKQSEVVYVSFEQEESPTQVMSLFYDTKENLKNIGVDLTREKVQISQRNPFPGRYCEPPKDR